MHLVGHANIHTHNKEGRHIQTHTHTNNKERATHRHNKQRATHRLVVSDLVSRLVVSGLDSSLWWLVIKFSDGW